MSKFCGFDDELFPPSRVMGGDVIECVVGSIDGAVSARLQRLGGDDLNGFDGIVRLGSRRSPTAGTEILIKISGG
ncbi:MAG: hypothetical protein QM706_11250 [Nitrospira sp.]